MEITHLYEDLKKKNKTKKNVHLASMLTIKVISSKLYCLDFLIILVVKNDQS